MRVLAPMLGLGGAVRAPMRRNLPAITLVAPMCTGRSLSSKFQKPVGARRARGPTREDLREMPRHISELPGDLLFLMTKSAGGFMPASRERLRREVMFVDGVSYEEAGLRIVEIAQYGRTSATLLKAPYYLGMATAYLAGYLSIPLVFSLSIAHWFNECHVKAEPPDEGERPSAPGGIFVPRLLRCRAPPAALHPRSRLLAVHSWQPSRADPLDCCCLSLE